MGLGSRLPCAKLFLAPAFIFCIIRNASALSITVEEKECISERVFDAGDLVSGNFVAIDHEIFWPTDHPGIDLEVTSPTGVKVHSLKGKSNDKFQFKALEIGAYKFCFYNPLGTPETVSFYIHVGHIPNSDNLATDEHLNPIRVKIAELKEALESITAEQKYLKARDVRHRHTNEGTRNRVVFYTVTEYILLAVSSAFQVAYIRRLFSDSIAYNRV